MHSTHTPVLSEEKELFIENGGHMSFLIEGDNLAALKLLLKTHRGEIDLIYIDPPYNTGGTGFRYDDNGVIFISIDDIELAQPICLCDSILGESNRVETIVWKSKYGAGAKTVGFIPVASSSGIL